MTEADCAREASAVARRGFSVVIPAHNEAGSLPALVDELRDRLAGVQGVQEIVVVDDGSDDETAGALAARRGPHALPLRVVRLAGHQGQSAALHAGVRVARAEWVATLDADGQNDPADIPRLLETLAREQAATGTPLRLICGHRWQRRDGWVKRIASSIANAVRSRLLGDDTPDTGCGLKLVHRETFLALPYFDHMHRFLPALVRRAGGRVMSVPVGHRPRRAGRSKYGVFDRLWVGIVDLAGVAWLQRRGRRPVIDRED